MILILSAPVYPEWKGLAGDPVAALVLLAVIAVICVPKMLVGSGWRG